MRQGWECCYQMIVKCIDSYFYDGLILFMLNYYFIALLKTVQVWRLWLNRKPGCSRAGPHICDVYPVIDGGIEGVKARLGNVDII